MKDAGQPPQWALRLLRSFCPSYLYEEIAGDLIQKFRKNSDRYGETRARRKLVWSVVQFFRPGIILRNSLSIDLTSLNMLRNYFNVALRFMSRNITYTSVNVFGLTLGITGATLLFLWIQREFTYDDFHSDKERIYQAWNKVSSDGQLHCWSMTPRILAPTLADDFTAVESAVSFANYQDAFLFTAGDTKVMMNHVSITDPQFLSTFSFPLVKGTVSNALATPNSIVLTEQFAKRMFGEKDAFDEQLTVGLEGEQVPFTVTGIIKDLPPNTDFQFEFLIPWQFLESIGEKDVSWENNSVSTYVKIKKDADIAALNKQIRDIRKKNTSDSDGEIFLYELSRLHLYAGFENGVPSGGRIEIVRMLGILGIFLLAIACINFINLSTARAQKRAREIAVRKVTGARRISLVIQFLCESVIIAFMAGILSLIIVYVSLPYFNDLVKQQLSLELTNIWFWLATGGLFVLIGSLAGCYPAFYLSSFQPLRIVKGEPVSSGNKGTLRSALVVFQFGFAVTLIVSVIVIHKQINFVQARDSGYSKDNLVYHSITGELEKNYLAYKNELIQSGIATSVTKTSSPITDRISNTSGIEWDGKDPQDKTPIERFYVDDDVTETLGVTIVQGRDMDLRQFPSDSSAVLLNETAVKLMNFKHPVGEVITDDGKDWHVIGVVKDFILTSPYQKIEPIVLLGSKGWFSFIHIRLNTTHPVQENITKLAGAFSKYNPQYPFEYHFVDEEYQRKFESLQTTLSITTLFSSMAIFIACLGLLGLSTYMIEARVKEIGIRKVMGGSSMSILKLLGWKSLKPIVIAIVLFSPYAWFSMNWWLQTFAYRIPLDAGVFLLAGVAVVSIAMGTIGIQTLRAARSNPVKSLRNE